MRWPWVSRALHEALVTELQRTIDRGEQQRIEGSVVNDRLLRRQDELTGEILRMRREGFVPQPEPPRQEEAHPIPQAVTDAIEERATTGAIRRQLATFAERQLREGVEEADLVKMILAGEQFEEDFV